MVWARPRAAGLPSSIDCQMASLRRGHQGDADNRRLAQPRLCVGRLALKGLFQAGEGLLPLAQLVVGDGQVGEIGRARFGRPAGSCRGNGLVQHRSPAWGSAASAQGQAQLHQHSGVIGVELHSPLQQGGGFRDRPQRDQALGDVVQGSRAIDPQRRAWCSSSQAAVRSFPCRLCQACLLS